MTSLWNSGNDFCRAGNFPVRIYREAVPSWGRELLSGAVRGLDLRVYEAMKREGGKRHNLESS